MHCIALARPVTNLFGSLRRATGTHPYGVPAVDERGIPALCREWWSNVDVLLPDDMAESWGACCRPRWQVYGSLTLLECL
jgi:hypothetical protein